MYPESDGYVPPHVQRRLLATGNEFPAMLGRLKAKLKAPGKLPRKLRAGLLEGYDINTGKTPSPDVVTEIENANLLTSELDYPGAEHLKLHAPVLDIDYHAELIPSSTPGHFHLVLDKALPWDKYQKVMRALADADLIEPGYAGASSARGYSAIRLPWIKKEKALV